MFKETCYKQGRLSQVLVHSGVKARTKTMAG